MEKPNLTGEQVAVWGIFIVAVQAVLALMNNNAAALFIWTIIAGGTLSYLVWPEDGITDELHGDAIARSKRKRQFLAGGLAAGFLIMGGLGALQISTSAAAAKSGDPVSDWGRVVWRPVPSGRTENPFALQLVIQVETEQVDRGIAFKFDQELSGVSTDVAVNRSMYMSNFSVNKNGWAVWRFGSISATNPLVVTVYSKRGIKLLAAVDYRE